VLARLTPRRASSARLGPLKTPLGLDPKMDPIMDPFALLLILGGLVALITARALAPKHRTRTLRTHSRGRVTRRVRKTDLTIR
jgi:hypothetical protein